MDTWYNIGFFTPSLLIAFDQFTLESDFITLEAFIQNKNIFYQMQSRRFKEFDSLLKQETNLTLDSEEYYPTNDYKMPEIFEIGTRMKKEMINSPPKLSLKKRKQKLRNF